ncbi:SGNH/GDSL hydrolase family protein [Paenibacillus sp. Marseille-Q9583]
MALQEMFPAVANSPATELSAAITDIQTTITLLDASKLPDAPNIATIGVDETAETVRYKGKSGNDLTGVTRGFSGTVAKAWAVGVGVARYFTAYDADALRGNIEDHSVQLADIATTDFASRAHKMLYHMLSVVNNIGGKATFVGDSVTEIGWFTPLQSLFPNITMVNKGIGGNGTVDVINRLADITATQADLYVLAIGTNDVRYQDPAKGATTATGYAANIETIYTALGVNKTVVLTPWPSFNGDYTSVLGFYERDNLMDQYIVEARKKCETASVPFVEVTEELRSLLDFNNKSSFLQDYIHPNTTIGRQLYSAVALFGKQQTEKWGVAKSKTSAKYIYKLEIRSSLTGDQIDLRYLQVKTKDNSALVGMWTTAMLSGYDDISQILNNAAGTYHFKNNAGDFPVVITFSSNSPIEYVNQTAHSYGGSIGAYKFYESEDPYSILDFDSSSWRKVAESDSNRISIVKQLYAWGSNKPKCYFKFEVVETKIHGAAWISSITSSRALDAYLNAVGSSNRLSSAISGTFTDQYIELYEGESIVFGAPTDAYGSAITFASSTSGDLVKRYRLYVTYDDITNVNKTLPAWVLISDVSDNVLYNISVTPSSQNKNPIPGVITYGNGMADRGFSAVRKVTGVVSLSLSVKKSSSWAANDMLATLPSGYRPYNTLLVNGMSHGDVSGVTSNVPILMGADGIVRVWNRAVNTNNDDSISVTVSFF